MADTQVDVEEIRAALVEEFRSTAAEARQRVAATLDPALPTPEFQLALADELGKAVNDPESVPYPELADPDRYWAASVQPQITACHDQIAAVLEWLESQVVQTMGVAEADLKRVVDLAIADRGADPAADRQALEADLHSRCSELHHQMGELLEVLPDRAGLDAAKASFAQHLTGRARADVDGLKAAYLAEAGGDESHQAFAEQQWSETYGERVAHREAMLAGAVPWRHQYLALAGYERSWTEAEAAIEGLVSRLQAPLGGIPNLLLERFDDAD